MIAPQTSGNLWPHNGFSESAIAPQYEIAFRNSQNSEILRLTVGTRLSGQLAPGASTVARGMSNVQTRPRLATFKKNANFLVSLGYVYNTLNDRISRTETISGIANVDAYDYDPIDQIKEVKYNFNSGTNTQDRLVNYVYDPAGNRQSLTDNGAVTNYSANDLNQYTAAGTLTPIHDLNGNLTGQGVWTYTYDAMNRMTAAQRQGTTVTFAYDPRNRCVKRTINNAVTFFYYDGWSLIEEQNVSGAAPLPLCQWREDRRDHRRRDPDCDHLLSSRRPRQHRRAQHHDGCCSRAL